MKVLVIGAGGREHALCWSLAASSQIEHLFCAPGSVAIAKEATLVPIAVDDLDGLVAFCREEAIDFVMPGPEPGISLIWALSCHKNRDGLDKPGHGFLPARLHGLK